MLYFLLMSHEVKRPNTVWLTVNYVISSKLDNHHISYCAPASVLAATARPQLVLCSSATGRPQLVLCSSCHGKTPVGSVLNILQKARASEWRLNVDAVYRNCWHWTRFVGVIWKLVLVCRAIFVTKTKTKIITNCLLYENENFKLKKDELNLNSKLYKNKNIIF